MKKFFLILVILFVIALIFKICLGGVTWKNVKDKSLTVKESCIRISAVVKENFVKAKDLVSEKIQEIKDKRKK
ncbi:MAG: hypothetical protein PHW62_05750 [Candidatus Ratteibacteria bacterium]|nr:hypothetical protein [Candidatus Ratteibacteria bacterium]